MNEELEIFLEDCEDQLQSMENALLQMQSGVIDEDAIGSIFRAVHTIKGSAGMFGFDDIVSFAHTGENLFDLIRQGSVKISPDMLTHFLLCKDHMEKLIDAVVNEEDISPQLEAIGEKLVEKLVTYMTPIEEVKEVVLNLNEIDDTSNKVTSLWHISIRFSKDFFTTGMSINATFNFLNKIGTIHINHALTYAIPLLEELLPTQAYIGFELVFETSSSKKEIEEVFEFIEDDVDLVLFQTEDIEAYDMLLQKRKESQLKDTLISAKLALAENFTLELQEDESSVSSEAIVEKEIKKKEKKVSTTLRVDSTKIDVLINYMSEIVIANSKILSLVASEDDKEENSELQEAANNMKELLEYVRDGIMDIRMIQVGDSFNKFKRIVNDTSQKIGKDVEFVISGEDTELDKTVVERISDPLVHMLRNSIDHGIELPAERLANGKSAKGRVDLRAFADSGSIVIEIEDDGKGLDKTKILAKAIENGQVHPNANLSDEEIFKLIFEAGLSTAEKVSDISGRGVGMDVVRRNIEDLRGTIDIESTLGKGSKIIIRLPLTLAIIDGFLVQVGNTKYIIPLENIKECIELSKTQETEMGSNEFINLRGEMLPLIDVRKILHEDKSIYKRTNIVIVYFGNKTVGLIVDELLGEYQTVIKSLGEVFHKISGISGGSILGSGEIALIFDIPRLIELKSRLGSDNEL
ncbi:chemotaxis protein CheA [Sulfurimonas sp. SAG-AH-194-C21]|nr:chemotaxis protein CheA [Sulfurimonas sp. SAG-AH-194-C21]MDF1884060.1 chemotaxis protein CheA [Sulfurimonas sp. SAG-AH-194-C21]